MKMTMGELRRLIKQGLSLEEAKWLAKPPKKLKDMLEPIEIDADTSKQAAQQAADKWFKEKGARGIDPFSVDVEKLADGDGGGAKKGSPIIFRLGTADRKVAERLKAKGFEIDGSTGDIVYDPDHWQEVGSVDSEDGFPLEYTMGPGLIPKSNEAKRLFKHARAIAAKTGRSAINIDIIRDAWQGDWEKDVDSVLS